MEECFEANYDLGERKAAAKDGLYEVDLNFESYCLASFWTEGASPWIEFLCIYC